MRKGLNMFKYIILIIFSIIILVVAWDYYDDLLRKIADLSCENLGLMFETLLLKSEILKLEAEILELRGEDDEEI